MKRQDKSAEQFVGSMVGLVKALKQEGMSDPNIGVALIREIVITLLHGVSEDGLREIIEDAINLRGRMWLDENNVRDPDGPG